LLWSLVAAAAALALLVLGPGFGLALGALGCLLVALIFAGRLLDQRDLFAPAVAFPAAYVVYFALGATNSLFGYVPPRVHFYQMIGLVAYLAGVWLAGLALGRLALTVPRRTVPATSARPAVRWQLDLAVAAALAISALAAAGIIVMTGGTPLANLSQRHGLSGYLFNLAELGWVAAVWWNFDRWQRRGRVSGTGIALLLVVAMMLALLAYRTPLMTMALAAALGFHRLVRPLHLRHVVGLGVVLLIFAGAYGWLRLQHTQRYGRYRDYLALTEFKWSPLEPIAPLAATVREGSVVLARLVANVPDKHPFQHGAVTFSTVATLLPGWQRGPREWIGILARDIEHSTTPTILGFLYVDFGVPGIVAGMALFGAFLTWLWDLALRRGTLLALWLWAYFTAVFLLSIHTGFADLRHGILAVFALGLAWASSPRPWAWLQRNVEAPE
jgi:hypothetical protein